MITCELRTCTGRGVIDWEIEELRARCPDKLQRVQYIKQNAESLRQEYCENVCPVIKFNRRYERR